MCGGSSPETETNEEISMEFTAENASDKNYDYFVGHRDSGLQELATLLSRDAKAAAGAGETGLTKTYPVYRNDSKELNKQRTALAKILKDAGYKSIKVSLKKGTTRIPPMIAVSFRWDLGMPG